MDPFWTTSQDSSEDDVWTLRGLILCTMWTTSQDAKDESQDLDPAAVKTTLGHIVNAPWTSNIHKVWTQVDYFGMSKVTYTF